MAKPRIIKVKAQNYNDFVIKLYRMMVDTDEVKVVSRGRRLSKYNMFDHNGKLAASYDEEMDYGIIYDYNTHSDLVGKVLTCAR